MPLGTGNNTLPVVKTSYATKAWMKEDGRMNHLKHKALGVTY